MSESPARTPGRDLDRQVRFGLLLSAGPADATTATRQIEEHFELTALAVSYGFDLVMVGQHFLPEDLRYYQPVPYLAWLGTAFPTIRVGTGILLLPLLRPIDVAEQIATLDVVTGGRVVLGVGIGYTDREFAALGVPRQNRVARLEEGLRIVLSLWSGRPTEHHGVFGDFLVTHPIVRPLQEPHPPIWLAGQAHPAVMRAARLADAWYPPPFLSHEELAELAAMHAAERAARGRPPATAVPIRREVFLADTTEQARDIAAPYALGRTKTYLDWGLRGEMGGTTAMHTETAATLGNRFLLGSPATVAAGLAHLQATVGMTDFVYRPQWPGMPFEQSREQLQRFGEEVIPLLGSANRPSPPPA
jgi:alkanesulfonate monooxygenase SsuD/methylene tetrahydromethanopterin reductase-like flavin-dependent oxidoreductase (luciferase family)